MLFQDCKALALPLPQDLFLPVTGVWNLAEFGQSWVRMLEQASPKPPQACQGALGEPSDIRGRAAGRKLLFQQLVDAIKARKQVVLSW